MKKVLVIGYVWVEPNSSAAGSHMMSILRLFREQNWQVEFTTPAQHSQHAIDLESEGISSKSIALNCDSFDQYVQTYQPDIVLFDRFMMEEQFGWRVEKNAPNALKILDTEDLQCLRHARHQAHKQKRPLSSSDLYGSNIAKREIASILRCDISLIISSFEMELLTQKFNVDASLLHYLPFMIKPNETPTTTKIFEERQHFISIGNFRHAPNWDMVLYLKEIWTSIRKKLPQVELHIYGAYPPPKATSLHNPKQGFYIKGWADDALSVMESARVCLAPIRFGAGIKGKLLDAMITQTPSVTTSIGAEGMYHGSNEAWAGVITDDTERFINASVQLYSDKNLWHQAQNHGKAILKNHYDHTQLSKNLIIKIETTVKKLQEHRLNNFTGSMLKHHSMMSTKYMSQWIAEKNKTTKLQNYKTIKKEKSEKY